VETTTAHPYEEREREVEVASRAHPELGSGPRKSSASARPGMEGGAVSPGPANARRAALSVAVRWLSGLCGEAARLATRGGPE
jgi:hypothetical protein